MSIRTGLARLAGSRFKQCGGACRVCDKEGRTSMDGFVPYGLKRQKAAPVFKTGAAFFPFSYCSGRWCAIHE
jgi:hypothetical protein